MSGGAGMVVGGLSGDNNSNKKVSKVAVKILLRDINFPILLIECFNSQLMTSKNKKHILIEGDKESYIYKICRQQSEDIKNIVSVIIDKVDSKEENESNDIKEKKNKLEPSNIISVADELLKLNDLKQKGIISNEEFLKQKEKVLNIK